METEKYSEQRSYYTKGRRYFIWSAS